MYACGTHCALKIRTVPIVAHGRTAVFCFVRKSYREFVAAERGLEVGRGRRGPAETHGRFLNGFLAGPLLPLEDGLGARGARLGVVVAERGSSSDAGTGDSPKSTDDSLTDFLRGSLFCSKMGSMHAKQLWGWSRCLLLKQHLWSQPPPEGGRARRAGGVPCRTYGMAGRCFRGCDREILTGSASPAPSSIRA